MKNERGAVLVFVTLMIVLLMIMVGMGLDTGYLTFTRATGQGAVDAAALSAITALPRAQADNNPSLVVDRATAFVSNNDYTGSSKNQLTSANVSYVKYDFPSDTITNYNEPLATANGVRVALEGGTAMKTPAFLTPLFNLFGASAPVSNNVSVSAVSVIKGRPAIPIAMWTNQCLPGNATNTNVQLAQQIKGAENSCWTTFLDKSSGASDIKALFTASETCSGLPIGRIDIGTKIYENKGQVASVYDTAKDFFEAYPDRCWTIPVIANSSKNCNDTDPTSILDWAKMCYKGIHKQGAKSYIKADVTCGQRLENNPDHLCFSNRLVREPAKGM
jgi:Flp pilus assembly protein TadG